MLEYYGLGSLTIINKKVRDVNEKFGMDEYRSFESSIPGSNRW